MKVKTSDLTGAALDYAVALSVGLNIRSQKREGVHKPGFYAVGDAYGYIWRDYGPGGRVTGFYAFNPSDCWRDGGQLIDMYVSWLHMEAEGLWFAVSNGKYGFGETPLLAACRSVVTSKLGDLVEVPDCLINGEQNNVK